MPHPLVQEIAYQDPFLLFASFAMEEGALFLDSAEGREPCARYSFIAVDPFQVLESKNGQLLLGQESISGSPFQYLQEELQRYQLASLPQLPPFQGGAAGYLAYELARDLERLPTDLIDVLHFPDLILGFYDLVIAFDQSEKKAWIFSSGFPEQEEDRRLKRADQRLKVLLEQIASLKGLPPQPSPPFPELEIRPGFEAKAYQQLVQKTIDYILAGDIFQANLSLPFYASLPASLNPFQIYQRLRQENPAPFAAYLNFSGQQLISASPERFLQLQQGQVETRPIKGTLRRGQTVAEDGLLAQQLLASEKDRAENVMIVDLLRNDLSRVCEDRSVEVPVLCALESFATVHHLVSVVKGRLRPPLTAVDLLKASFPGGSITGAPKLRAMEIIAELEKKARGPYCGSILYLGFDGSMDSSITIRTICVKGGELSFQAGGAVVLDSSPQKEYEEVLLKAKAMFKALGCSYDSLD